MTGDQSGQRPCGQYLVGLCLAGLGVCAAGWLVVMALAFAWPASGSPGGRWNDATVATLATGAWLALISSVTFVCWARAWWRALRADGVLAGTAPGPRQPSRSVTLSDSEAEPVRPASADRMLSELRELLIPLVSSPEAQPPPPLAPGPLAPLVAVRTDRVSSAATGSPDAEEHW